MDWIMKRSMSPHPGIPPRHPTHATLVLPTPPGPLWTQCGTTCSPYAHMSVRTDEVSLFFSVFIFSRIRVLHRMRMREIVTQSCIVCVCRGGGGCAFSMCTYVLQYINPARIFHTVFYCVARKRNIDQQALHSALHSPSSISLFTLFTLFLPHFIFVPASLLLCFMTPPPPFQCCYGYWVGGYTKDDQF